MTVADLTNLTSVNGFGDMIIFLNQVTDNWFMNLFVISFCLILTFILSRRSTPIKAFWVSCALSTILCFIFMLTNFMNYVIFIIFLVLTVIMTALNYMEVG